MAEPVCSAISLAWGEPLFATASIVRNWLLVEHPGAWGPAALTESGLPAHVSAGLAALSEVHGIRVLLLRRPVRPSDGARQCFLAHTGRHDRWIEERVVEDLDELLTIDFSPIRRGRRVGFGGVRSQPLYLVCTNGRHDRGRAGEPFAAQAAEHFLRARERLLGVDDLVVTAHRPQPDGVVDVGFDGPGGRSYTVRVQVMPAAHPRQLACRSINEAQPPTYALVDVNGR